MEWQQWHHPHQQAFYLVQGTVYVHCLLTLSGFIILNILNNDIIFKIYSDYISLLQYININIYILLLL